MLRCGHETQDTRCLNGAQARHLLAALKEFIRPLCPGSLASTTVPETRIKQIPTPFLHNSAGCEATSATTLKINRIRCSQGQKWQPWWSSRHFSPKKVLRKYRLYNLAGIDAAYHYQNGGESSSGCRTRVVASALRTRPFFITKHRESPTGRSRGRAALATRHPF
jgi:hypothetical protein